MSDLGIQKIFDRLNTTLARDILVQTTTNSLREALQVDRVVLYYFYREWEGRVTFESLSAKELSILGSTGPSECFNAEYAALYEAGRVRAIANIETEPIEKCHQDFLKNLKVRANLVVPILVNENQRLWGLLVAHHCQDIRPWFQSDVEIMQTSAQTLATSSVIKDS